MTNYFCSHCKEMTLILVSGKAGSGKTTFSDYIVSMDKNVVSFALADKVKELTFKLLQIFGIKIESIDDLNNVETKEKYRKYMQQIATEAMRTTFGQDFWCEQLSSKINKSIEEHKNVIISDVRFSNEQKYFKSRFDNVKCIMIKRKSVEKEPIHESENTSQLHYDIEINNDGTIEEFKSTINDAIDELMIDGNNDESVVSIHESDSEIDERSFDIHDKIDERSFDIHDKIDERNDEKIVNQIIPEKDEMFVKMMNEKNDENTSQHLGVIGEKYVLDLLHQIRPKNETLLVSTMSHVADLHSIDQIHNLFWMIEVKNKSTLTTEDVNKFKRDLARITQQQANNKLKVIGLFLSLRSTSIPKIGDLFISGNEIYLSKSYFTNESLKIVFNFVEQYQTFFDASNSESIQGEQRTILSGETLELFALLNTEYQHLARDLELYDSMRSNCSTNLQHIEELTISARMKQRLIYCLNRQISNSDDVIDKTAEDIQYNSFIEFVKTQKRKSNIQKQIIIQQFPALITPMNRVGWVEYRNQVWELAHKECEDDEKEVESIEIPKEVVDYAASLNNINKLLKSDIMKKYPITIKTIKNVGWSRYKNQLWMECKKQ